MTAISPSDNYLPDVREQYEQLPYPTRNPNDELSMLRVTTGSMLEYLNHHGFSGRMKLKGLRMLEAGGGTGDATIFMAEQLHRYGGRVTYMDLSEASLAIARERASIRKLDNIEFVHGSLLDLPKMGLEPFDYVNCNGVLHHLADPSAGLNALKAVLKPDGLMKIMVYGQYARAEIYRMQALMRDINAGVDGSDVPARIARCKSVMDVLKSVPWYQQARHRFTDIDSMGDAGIYDLFLHTQDRAYTIAQLYEWVESCGLNLHHYIEKVPHQLDASRLPPSDVREWILQQDVRTQQHVMEQIRGDIAKHNCYLTLATREPASFADMDMVAFYSLLEDAAQQEIGEMIRHAADGQHCRLETKMGVKYQLKMTPLLRHVLSQIDGQRTIGQIAQEMSAQVEKPLDVVIAKLESLLMPLNELGLIFLRDASLPAFPSLNELQGGMQQRRLA